MNWIAKGDARRLPLRSGIVHCVVTSPPFWALRKYPEANSIGHEPTFAEHVANLVQVFRELSRVLRDDGTVWMEYGDSWAHQAGFNPNAPSNRTGSMFATTARFAGSGQYRSKEGWQCDVPTGNLQLLPFRVAMALQDDGWFLRSVCIWHKPNAMPESVRNRPTHAHSYIFLLTKRATGYFYDGDAERTESDAPVVVDGWLSGNPEAKTIGKAYHKKVSGVHPSGAALRTVWTIPTQPLKLPHFAAFPEELARRCISLGTSAKGVCPTCGKPWVRVVESRLVQTQATNNSGKGARGGKLGLGRSSAVASRSRDPFLACRLRVRACRPCTRPCA